MSRCAIRAAFVSAIGVVLSLASGSLLAQSIYRLTELGTWAVFIAFQLT